MRPETNRPDHLRFDGESNGESELVSRTYRGLRLDFTGAETVTIQDCVIESCQVVASRGTEVRIVRSAVNWSDLSGVRISRGCARSTFRECKFAGTDFAGGTLQDVSVAGSILSDVSLRSSTVRRVEFDSCRVEDLDARGAVLEHVTFAESTLARADFDKATCVAVDLSMAAELSVRRASALSGCRVSVPQALDLAFALAGEAGLVVDFPDEDPR